MGYASFKESPKALVKGDDIGSGQIELRHLAPGLYVEFQQVGLHSHTGVKSRKINMRDLEGSWGATGFYMYSSDGTKRYHVTIDSSLNAFVLTVA